MGKNFLKRGDGGKSGDVGVQSDKEEQRRREGGGGRGRRKNKGVSMTLLRTHSFP